MLTRIQFSASFKVPDPGPCCLKDAAVCVVLANLLLSTLETPLKRMARELPQLVAFCQRIRSHYQR